MVLGRLEALSCEVEQRWGGGVNTPDIREGGGEFCCECPAKERRFAVRRHVGKLVRGQKGLGVVCLFMCR